jgi:hypothetical protein
VTLLVCTGPVHQEAREVAMNNLNLLAARAEIARRVTDAEQRRRARTCRTGRPSATSLTRPAQS